MGNEAFEWFEALDERQQMEVQFAKIYADSFHHGTTGHNAYMLIAAMADKLYDYENELKTLRAAND